MSEPLAADLSVALAAVDRWLSTAGVPAVIIGGIAASILGRPRLTRDIDTLVDVPETRWPELLDAAIAHGIHARIDEPLAFARRARVLLMRHAESAVDVDVILSGLPFERDAIAGGRRARIGSVEISIPRVEDLMIMKAIAHRPRDLSDLEGLLDANADADLARVRRWVREFSEAATLPELLEDFDRLVQVRRRSP